MLYLNAGIMYTLIRGINYPFFCPCNKLSLFIVFPNKQFCIKRTIASISLDEKTCSVGSNCGISTSLFFACSYTFLVDWLTIVPSLFLFEFRPESLRGRKVVVASSAAVDNRECCCISSLLARPTPPCNFS